MAMASILTDEEIGRMQGNISEADFGRIEFLEIIHVEKPRIIYKSGAKHFFFLAGLAVSTKECSDSDFGSDHLMLPWLTGAIQQR
jgi:hypothetical protein